MDDRLLSSRFHQAIAMILLFCGTAAGQIVSPTQGRPMFVAPGGAMPIRIQTEKPPATVAVELRRDDPPRAYPLRLSETATSEAATGRFSATVPADVPARTYDLVIRLDQAEWIARHCVAVGVVGRRVRLVHLSDLNAGDLCGPELEPRLVEEVNLLNPALIVATGDFLDATWPDRETGWQQVMDFLARFEAPTLMARGDHDDVELFGRFAAPSPEGVIELGPHRGIVLSDLASAPISEDDARMAWLERMMLPAPRGVTFLVGHDSSPNALRRWEREGTLEDLIRSGRVGLYFAGGHRDWDGREQASLIRAAAPLLYVRTQRAGPAPREGGDGIPHYRVVDLEQESVWVPGDSGETSLPPSLACGRLLMAIEGRNDGSESAITFTAANRHPFPLAGLAVTLRLKKTGTHPPCSALVRVENVADLGTMWECRAVFDLMDKSSIRATLSTNPAPAEPAIDVRFDVPPVIKLTAARTAGGAAYWTTEAVGLVHLTNGGEKRVELAPLVRLDGEPIAYMVADARTAHATAFKVSLAAGQSASLQLDLSALRVTPGRRTIQVYLRDEAGWKAHSRVVRLEPRECDSGL